MATKRKAFLVSAILMAMASFHVGCATSRIDSQYIRNLKATDTSSIIYHESWTRFPGQETQSGLATAAQANLGLIPALIIGIADIQHTAAIQKQQRFMLQQRTDACIAAIDKTLLSESQRFSYQSMSQYPSSTMATNQQAQEVVRAIGEKGLSLGLAVKINYAFASGFKKDPRLYITWTMFDKAGAKKGTWVTHATAKGMGKEVFPHVEQQSWDAHYINLTPDNVRQFLKNVEAINQ